MTLLSVLSLVIMATALAVFGLRSYRYAIGAFVLQTLTLVTIYVVLGIQHNAHELFTWAGVAFCTQVVLIPFILYRLVVKLNVKHEDEPVLGFFVSPIIAIAFSLAAGMVVYPIYLEFSLIKEVLPAMAGITVFMLGVFGFVLRNSAVKLILAYCTFENGIHLTLSLMAYNSPEIAELGIVTDAIFAVIIMSVLAQRFYKYFGSLDASKANLLKG